MDSKGSVEWRLVWIILVIITMLAIISLIIILFYASSHGSFSLSQWSNLLGGGS